MLQIPRPYFLHDNFNYPAFVHRYLPATGEVSHFNLLVQQELLDQLDKQVYNEQFYFITDVSTGDIIHCNGVGRWLGYPDQHFTQQKYMSIMYPAHALAESLYAAARFEAIAGGQISVSYLEPAFITTIALKHKSGQYFYCKRRCYALQFTSQQQVAYYINEFNIVKHLSNESFHTRLQQEHPKQASINGLVKKKAQQHFQQANIFSTQELRILKRYCDKTNASNEAVARAFKIKKATVNTYNKRIMKKAAHVFEQSFENAASVARHIQLAGLI